MTFFRHMGILGVVLSYDLQFNFSENCSRLQYYISVDHLTMTNIWVYVRKRSDSLTTNFNLKLAQTRINLSQNIVGKSYHKTRLTNLMTLLWMLQGRATRSGLQNTPSTDWVSKRLFITKFFHCTFSLFNFISNCCFDL